MLLPFRSGWPWVKERNPWRVRAIPLCQPAALVLLTNQTRSHHQWFSAARAGDRSRVYDYTLLTLAPTSRRQSRLRRRRQFIRGLQKLLVFVPAYELQRHKTTSFACVTITTTVVSMVSDSCKSFQNLSMTIWKLLFFLAQNITNCWIDEIFSLRKIKRKVPTLLLRCALGIFHSFRHATFCK